jgi:ubiquinone/menaquinone biosynthesis C-methylase UbiE
MTDQLLQRMVPFRLLRVARSVAQTCALVAIATAMLAGCCPPPPRIQHKLHAQPATTEYRVHSGHHRFDNAERWAKRFESPDRARWQKPDQVITKLGLTKNALVADIGSGTGYFAVRLARAVPEGKVWGVDLEDSMVRYLQQRAEREGLSNLISVRGRGDSSELKTAVDLIFVCNTYHHILDPVRYFLRLRDRLKPNGRLVIVDFKMGKIPVGPPEAHRVAPETLDHQLVAAGYARVEINQVMLPYQYLAIYRRN